ncbi:aminoglycoside phosphotransferase family protein [Nocardioides panacisoli]|uniref:phosphotransferase family protein n=1 Tax=Nocardioides panacisoli TaxID=627624 RepID=UPI001C632832|nr:phosphotransferase [Nocardioides panacisoli]QYJ04992.1 aminoglycoside phosphotransferase family protein [Nocardioides panacisoli]
MWQPEPDWHPLPGGTGTSTVGVWRTALGGEPVVIKRLAPPGPDEPRSLSDPDHVGYWRREADVLTTGLTTHTPGLRSVVASVAEDAEGVTITRDWVEDAASSGLFLAIALGRFAGAEIGRPRFLARRLLRDRLARVEHNGGWPTLARTPVADVAEHLWSRRAVFLDLLDGVPQVPQHGDPTPGNLPGREGGDAVAIDWGTLGIGPVGGDLGYLALSAREEFEPLLDAYLMGVPEGVADREDVVLGAQVTAVFTALSRAEWALARVAGGEGALGSKFRHPAVAPHLRALQRQYPLIEALLQR